MSVESTTSINGLNGGTPLSEDSKSEGDNHIRLIKTVLLATFSGFAGRMDRVIVKGSNHTLALTDNHSVLRFTAGATISGVPSSVGNGWSIAVINDSSTQLIIDPTGDATINGALNLNVSPKSAVTLFCDGAAFYAIGLQYPTSGVSNGGEFASGTRLMFQQATAPLGWTLENRAEYNNSALRLVTGAPTVGGVNAFSTVFNSTFNVDGHAVTVNEMPFHGHTGSGSTSADGNHTHTVTITAGQEWDSGGPNINKSTDTTSTQAFTYTTAAAGVHAHTVSVTVNGAGGNQPHIHGLTANLKFVDFILATKQ